MRIKLGRVELLLLLTVSVRLMPCTSVQTCDQGSEPSGNPTTCIECEQGKYKASAGTGPCSTCPANYFSSSERAQDLEGAGISMKVMKTISSSTVVAVSKGLIRQVDRIKVICLHIPPRI